MKKYQFIVYLLLCSNLIAQKFIGDREIINYDKRKYSAGNQNWEIQQDKAGRMYFANSEGVLSFDGNYWELFPLPNKTIVWSIKIAQNNKLYIGGQDEMGYLSPDKRGKLAYTSLVNLLDESDQKFADIWNIVSEGDDIFFRSNSRLFKYNKDKIKIYMPSSSWLFLGKFHNKVIAHDEARGLMIYERGSWELFIKKQNLPLDFFITSMCEYKNGASIITTFKNGVYILSENGITPLIIKEVNNNQHFTNVIKIDDSDFLLGTYNNGFYLINDQKVSVESFSKLVGLQNNNIRSLFIDKSKNIWIGLNNGISYIPYNNAIKNINPSIFRDGAGYSMSIFDHHIYFASSNGIFEMPYENIPDLSYSKNLLKMISEGQTWKLGMVNNQLLAGKEDGLYQIKNHQVKPIDKKKGYWIFESMINENNNKIVVAGNYEQVQLFNGNGIKLKETSFIKSFSGSARFLALDSNKYIWVSHPYRGVYKINLQDSSTILYNDKNGLPSLLDNHVYKIKNKVLIATVKGIYEYNKNKDKFEIANDYKNIYGNNSVRFLKEDMQGNIWFVQDKNIGVIDFSEEKPTIYNIPELKGNIQSGFENIFSYDKNNTFIGGQRGFYHINYEKYKKNITKLKVNIRRIKIKGEKDSILFGGYLKDINEEQSKNNLGISKVKYQLNSFHFEFVATYFEQQMNIEYSYQLEGFDKNWSDWNKKTEIDYTNLPIGSYTFLIKARNNLNNESNVNSFKFEVLPPWYFNIYSILVYLILFSFLLYILYKLQARKYRKKYQLQQKELELKHLVALEKTEKDLIKIKNENLESAIEFKNSELASSAMNLVQKKEFILKIKSTLQNLNKNEKEGADYSELKKILRSLSDEEKLNNEWEQFSLHFNNVHGDFLIKLNEKFTNLNAHELKLCTYLRMNLTSKEIAQLMSISVRGVEISRYRLRKKLNIATETNLFQFLLEI